jgi:C-terminal processing protease CtpA/Prc
MECCGLQVAVDPTKTGFEIVQLAENSRLAKAGAKVSDRIVEINGQPLKSVDQLEVLTKDSGAALSVQRGRSRRLVKLSLESATAQAAEDGQ